MKDRPPKRIAKSMHKKVDGARRNEVTRYLRKEKRPVASGPGGLEVLALEYALNELFGTTTQWQDCLKSPAEIRKAIRAAAQRLERRIDGITTADARLIHTLHCDLDRLRSAADALPKNGDALLSIAATLLHLVAHLLGFDWFRGKPNREIVYFQTLAQAEYDDRKWHPKEDVVAGVELLITKRFEIVLQLHNQGLRPAQIARIMGLSDRLVRETIRPRTPETA